MEDSPDKSMFSSVRAKLTAAFVAIIVLFSLATLASDKGFRSLRTNLDEIHDTTLPRVLALEGVAIRIPDVLALAGTIVRSENKEVLDGLVGDLREVRFRLADAAARSEEDAGDLVPLLEELGDSLDKLTQVHHSALVAQDVAYYSSETAASAMSEVADALDEDLILARDEAQAGTIRDLQVQLLGTAANFRVIPNAQDDDSLGVIRMEFELARRKAARLLVGLERSTREARAKSLMALLRGTTEDQSPFTLKQLHLDAAKDVKLVQQRGFELGGRLQRRAGELLQSVQETVRTSRADALDRAFRARRAAQLYWLSALIVSLFILFAYVLRSVIRALDHLVADLTSLSQGKLDVEVRSGSDRELAEIARAAEQFRRNSRVLEITLGTLEKRNQTLTEFAHVASHDLKSPMRAIAHLSTWISDDAADVLSDESKAHLELMRDRVEKMETLLEELLRYSRLGNDERIAELVDVESIVRDVVDLLSLPKEVELHTVDCDVQVTTITAPLKLCLRNLIQNAVNHSDQERPRVTVSTRLYDESPSVPARLEIAVEDNGPGIPELRRDEALRIFRKLDYDSDGSGMGLALAKRSAEMMGGTIKIEGASDRGARIVFGWPVNIRGSAVTA